jgi:hypothetical protein
MGNKPEHCEYCGAIVMMLLVNDPNAQRRWVPATWSMQPPGWIPHTCQAPRAEL